MPEETKQEEVLNPEEIEKIIEEEPKKVDDVLAEVVVNEKSKKKIKATDIKVGMYLRVYQRIFELNAKGEEKGRLQMFEGLVIARKHGNEPGATFTVRKVTKTGHIVERIYPVYLPTLEKIELMKIAKRKKSKMYYLRNRKTNKLKFVK
ncbi:MAG TPA: 50S ribosomal protein L19 [bacterium]|nr:50S ribosomal protein L19 [Patescibacteria group bacterium]HPO11074.1 50S ribosomal protein L19 [bacterium]